MDNKNKIPKPSGFLMKSANPLKRTAKEDSVVKQQQNQPQLKNKAAFKFAQKKEVKEKIAKKKASVEKEEMQILRQIPQQLMPLYDNCKTYTLGARAKAYFIAKLLKEGDFKGDQSEICAKVRKEFCMNDSQRYIEVKQNGLKPRFHPGYSGILSFKPQIEISTTHNLWPGFFIAKIVQEIGGTVSLIEESNVSRKDTHQYSVILTLRDLDLFHDEMKFTSGTFDYKQFVGHFLKSITASEQVDKEESLGKVWRILGFDTINQQGRIVPNNLINIKVDSYQIYRCSGYTELPSTKPRQFLEPQYLIPSQIKPEFNAEKSLYAISRARIQYLGQNIPIFKYGHQLFEALISAIHPEDVSPEGVDNSTDLTTSDLLRQETSLYRHYFQFSQHPQLQPLLTYSLSGQTEELIHYFNNSLAEGEYSRIKLSLYDINQRKFVFDNTAHPRKGFIVHYNGYLFGTNHAKMFTIREREIGLHQDNNIAISLDDSESDQGEVVLRQTLEEGPTIGLGKRKEKSIGLKNDEDIEVAIKEDGSGSMMSESDNMIDSEEEDMGQRRAARDDIVSEVDMRTAFVMTSNFMKTGNRKKKILAMLPKNNGSASTGCGLLSIKIEFDKTQHTAHLQEKQIKRLICYGTFPWINQPSVTQFSQQKTQQVFKVFEGTQAHLHFMTWLLQHVINYRKDSRNHSRFVNIFTYKGQSKELPLMLQALITIVGRDTHFIGDLNKLKLVWYENIRFFDFCNYFEARSLAYFAQKWVRNKEQVSNLKKTAGNDLTILKTLILYEVVLKFIDELQSIAFNNGKNFYNLTLHGQASASSLALSVFQNMYLDKQHIKGTSDQDIFEIEKKSLKGPYFTRSTIVKELSLVRTAEEESDTKYSLYEIKHSIPLCYKEFPIPFEYTKRREYRFNFQFEEGKYQTNYKYQQSLDVWNPETRQAFKLVYTSLYKVEKLEKLKNTFILPEQTPHGLKFNVTTLTDQYIWGAELIHAIIEQGRSNSVIAYLEVTEEISYLQGKIFSSFVNEIWDKYRYTQNPCQKDILEMILQSFPSKLNQKFFGVQQIIHINDLLLMKQTCLNLNQSEEGTTQQPIQKLYELNHPYYYIEYYPTGSDQLQQICSLVRITSYINACHRIKQFQALQQFDSPRSIASILYLDHQYLLLKNKDLIDHSLAKLCLPASAKMVHGESMGKYRLILQAKHEDQEMQAYMRFFKQRGEVINIMHNETIQVDHENREEQDKSLQLAKFYNHYKLLAQDNIEANTTEDQLIQNFMQIILSSSDSLYQQAPLIQEEPQQKYMKSQKIMSQKLSQATHNFQSQIGITIEQAKQLKIMVDKLFKRESSPELANFLKNQPIKRIENPQQNLQIDEALFQNPLFQTLTHDRLTQFEALLQKDVPTEVKNVKQDDAYSESSFVDKVKIPSHESDSDLMSQDELSMAMHFAEESSQQGIITNQMVKIGRATGGNLVSEFFSQTK